jgi:hypothetical protein
MMAEANIVVAIIHAHTTPPATPHSPLENANFSTYVTTSVIRMAEKALAAQSRKIHARRDGVRSVSCVDSLDSSFMIQHSSITDNNIWADGIGT